MIPVPSRSMGLTLDATTKPETGENISRYFSDFKHPATEGPGLHPVMLLAGARWPRIPRHQTTRTGRNKRRARARRETALISGVTSHPTLPIAAYGQGNNLTHYCLIIDYRAAAGLTQVRQQRREAQHCGQDTSGSRYGRLGYTEIERWGPTPLCLGLSQAGQADGGNASRRYEAIQWDTGSLITPTASKLASFCWTGDVNALIRNAIEPRNVA